MNIKINFNTYFGLLESINYDTNNMFGSMYKAAFSGLAYLKNTNPKRDPLICGLRCHAIGIACNTNWVVEIES